MPANPRQLSVIGYANGFTAWHYRHDGTLADLLAPGFFNTAAGIMRDGDQVAVSAPDEQAILAVWVDGNGVDVSLLSRAVRTRRAKAAA